MPPPGFERCQRRSREGHQGKLAWLAPSLPRKYWAGTALNTFSLRITSPLLCVAKAGMKRHHTGQVDVFKGSTENRQAQEMPPPPLEQQLSNLVMDQPNGEHDVRKPGT